MCELNQKFSSNELYYTSRNRVPENSLFHSFTQSSLEDASNSSSRTILQTEQVPLFDTKICSEHFLDTYEFFEKGRFSTSNHQNFALNYTTLPLQSTRKSTALEEYVEENSFETDV